jgi:hypothetical protein
VALPPIQCGIDGVEAIERADADMMTIPKLKQLCVEFENLNWNLN